MNLTSPREIKSLLKKHSAQPQKGLGQRFLIDKKALRKILAAANLKPGDTILEIGPGIGTLTQELAKRARKVVAIEKDPKMVEILKETLKTFKNTKIILGDILKINTRYYIQDTKYKVVANLPYYITSPVIRKFLELAEVRPLQMVLMVQKEVAQRIVARPPESKRINPLLRPSLPLGHMNLLAVSVQFYAKPEIISYVSKKSFWPSPKVDSAILKISAINQRRKSAFNQRFFKIVKAGFSQPRKQLLNNLSKKLKLDKEKVKLWLQRNKIKPVQRAETLAIKDWINLTKSYQFISNQLSSI